MKVILTHEVTGLGTAGDVVDVKDGYARNFLFKRDLATAWTKGGQKQVEAIAKGVIAAYKALKPAMEDLLLFSLKSLADGWGPAGDARGRPVGKAGGRP